MPSKTKSTDKAVVKAVQEIEYQKQASGALVDGIIGIFFLPLVFGIIAIVRSNIASKSEDQTTFSKARTGKILGIIDLCLVGVRFFILLIAVSYS